jgi:hypothetical protein
MVVNTKLYWDLHQQQDADRRARSNTSHITQTMEELSALLQQPPPRGRTAFQEAKETIRRENWHVRVLAEAYDRAEYTRTTLSLSRCASCCL